MEIEREIPVAVIGSTAVGKTAIIGKLISAIFEEEHNPTGDEEHQFIFHYEGTPIKLNIFDTSGSENYAEAREARYHTGEGFVAVYSIVDKKSFDELKKFIEKLHDVKGTKKVPMVLVGCKRDLKAERQVPDTDGEEYAMKLNCPFVEISAKERELVVDVFTKLIQEIDRPASDNERVNSDPKERRCCTVL